MLLKECTCIHNPSVFLATGRPVARSHGHTPGARGLFISVAPRPSRRSPDVFTKDKPAYLPISMAVDGSRPLTWFKRKHKERKQRHWCSGIAKGLGMRGENKSLGGESVAGLDHNETWSCRLSMFRLSASS